ncbi:MAG: type II secretion system protein [Phycisphaerales bacterium]
MHRAKSTRLPAVTTCSGFRRGFTIVEVLVVVGIMALLIALILPALSKTRRSSQTAASASNLKQLGVALEMYTGDNRGWLPRALPLVNDPSDPASWDEPWPADQCPIHWAMGYPASVVSYMGYEIYDPLDYGGFSDPSSKNYIPRPEEDPSPADKFVSPANEIPLSDLESRKCGYPIDYGMTNWASQELASRLDTNRHYLAGDQTWGLAYVEGSGGPNEETELNGWWVPFVHANQTAHILGVDLGVSLIDKARFIERFTGDPPDDPI